MQVIDEAKQQITDANREFRNLQMQVARIRTQSEEKYRDAELALAETTIENVLTALKQAAPIFGVNTVGGAWRLHEEAAQLLPW